MNLEDRYIQAVCKRLPQHKRDQVAADLKAKIAASDFPTMEEKLNALGDPSRIADAYRGYERSLIGPRYYETYLLVLKIVAIVLACTMGAGLLFFTLLDPVDFFENLWTSYLPGAFNAFLQAFAWVTLVFIFLEAANRNTKEATWNLSDLSQEPPRPRKNTIPIADGIFSLIFAFLIYGILFTNSDWIAIYSNTNGIWNTFPLLSATFINENMSLFLTAFFLAFSIGLIKLLFRRWNVWLATLYGVLTIAGFTLWMSILTNEAFYNPTSVSKVKEAFEPLPFSMLGSLRIVFVLLLVLTLIDIASTFYKAFQK
ncbi:MAG: hypothetical protein ACRDBX_00865 [Erysipelotrichaceae bacterium]